MNIVETILNVCFVTLRIISILTFYPRQLYYLYLTHVVESPSAPIYGFASIVMTFSKVRFISYSGDLKFPRCSSLTVDGSLPPARVLLRLMFYRAQRSIYLNTSVDHTQWVSGAFFHECLQFFTVSLR